MKRITLLTIICLGLYLSGTGQITKNLTTNLYDLKIEKIGEYDKITLNNTVYANDIAGHPELPVCLKSFVIPRDALINGVSVNSVNKQKMKGEYNVFPAQQF